MTTPFLTVAIYCTINISPALPPLWSGTSVTTGAVQKIFGFITHIYFLFCYVFPTYAISDAIHQNMLGGVYTRATRNRQYIVRVE